MMGKTVPILLGFLLFSFFLFHFSVNEVYAQSDEEWEESCSREEVPSTMDGSEVPTYRKKDGRSQPQMREDAGLNFNAAVKGTHCGQTKSQSVILQEVAPFYPDEGPVCKTVRWAGEIQINYGQTENFLIPFAEELADHWAGTLDAEHMKEEEIDQLYALAYPDFSAAETADQLHRMVRDASTASAELKRRQGVLKYLLPPEKQDELKCSFIRYVQQKGNLSAYPNFTIEGTKLTEIPCPPTIDNPQATLAEYQTWQKDWGSKWEKMGLFPNEKSLGMLRFAVCEDRVYDLGVAYPEVFRLGLSANELFKIFTPKEGQERYYRANNDQNNLKQPLDKNRVLAYGQSETTFSDTSAPRGFGELISTAPNQVPNLVTSFKNLLPTIKSAFAQTVGRVLLAQGPGGEITVTPAVEIRNGQIEYQFTVTSPVDGHFIFELWVDNQKTGFGESKALNIYNNRTITYSTPGLGGTRNLPVFSGDHTITLLVKCDDCNIPQQGQEIWTSCTITGGASSCEPATPPPPPPGPGGIPVGGRCDPTVACCVTGDSCSPTCKLCNIAQKGPSDTTLWPKGYMANHVLLGVLWPGGELKVDDETKVPLTWKIPEWDGTLKNLPPGCTFTPCAPSDKECQTNPPYCLSDVNQCGKIACTKVHDRVVNVYNNVPFLASAWKQAADQGGTLETSCYNDCLSQGNSSSECRGACGIPGGFLNIFKPYCNPYDSQSICNQAARQTSNFNGCTTNERYVFDRSGNFRPNPAYSEVTYGFDQGFGVGAERQQYDFGQDEVTVTQISPKPGEKAKVTFYRLGGLCNVNTWVSQKELNPWRPGEVNPFYQGGIITPSSGPCAGKTIDPNKLYHIETCEEAEPEPACCAKMGQGEYAKECVWEDRWWCRPESCNLIPEGQSKARCGAGINTFYRTGRELAQ